jgi:hypothetical protein
MTSSLVIVGKDEDLRFAGQASKCARMENAVAVAFETGAYRVGFFVGAPVARPQGAGCGRRQMGMLELFALMSQYDGPRFAATGPRVGMGDDDGIGRIPGHGARPTFGALGEIVARIVRE